MAINSIARWAWLSANAGIYELWGIKEHTENVARIRINCGSPFWPPSALSACLPLPDPCLLWPCVAKIDAYSHVPLPCQSLLERVSHLKFNHRIVLTRWKSSTSLKAVVCNDSRESIEDDTLVPSIHISDSDKCMEELQFIFYFPPCGNIKFLWWLDIRRCQVRSHRLSHKSSTQKFNHRI